MRALRAIFQSFLLASLSAWTAMAAPPESGSPPTPTPVTYAEPAVRAAFLLNFAKFTEWPTVEGREAITLGVVDDPEVEAALWRITTGQRIQGRPVRVVRLLAPEDIQSCDVLYIRASDATQRREWLGHVGKHPVLTVSNHPDFLREGGDILLFNDGRNLRFEINIRAVQASGLAVSSRLMALSRPHPASTQP